VRAYRTFGGDKKVCLERRFEGTTLMRSVVGRVWWTGEAGETTIDVTLPGDSCSAPSGGDKDHRRCYRSGRTPRLRRDGEGRGGAPSGRGVAS
jgi:hypothetical protein